MKRYYIAPEEMPQTKRQYNDEIEFVRHTDALAAVESARAECRERVEALESAILAVEKSGVFGCCPFCGAGWDGDDEPHSPQCPVGIVKAARAAGEKEAS